MYEKAHSTDDQTTIKLVRKETGEANLFPMQYCGSLLTKSNSLVFLLGLLTLAGGRCFTSVQAMSPTPPTTTDTNTLLPHLRKAFPTVESYEILTTIVQSNAKGFILKLEDSQNADTGSTTTPSQVFMKLVDASEYVSQKKDWNDLRRTLMYARTEERFYASIQPLLAQKGFHGTPTCYLSESDLQGWIGDDEHATDAANPTVDKDSLPDADKKGGLLILDCISPNTHFQDSPLTMDQCRSCLAAVAQLHAAAWQDTALLERAERELSKASFHLSTRNPKELAGIESAWAGFCEAFSAEMQEAGLANQPDILDLGRRLAAVAEYTSRQVSPAPKEPFATLIHGDYKSMNAFLPRKPDDPAILVDFASCGPGLGMSDVAMHIHHAVVPENLENGGEEALVKYYWQCLQNSLNDVEYPWEEALRHYKLAVVDYGRFFMARMWKGATPAVMLKKKDNKNVNLINRSPPAAMRFIRQLNTYLKEIEEEVKANSQEL